MSDPSSGAVAVVTGAGSGIGRAVALALLGAGWRVAHGIACGQIDIGNVASELTEPMAAGIAQADGSLRVEPRFDVRHVADAVLCMAGLPLPANVQFMTVMATAMPYIVRG